MAGPSLLIYKVHYCNTDYLSRGTRQLDSLSPALVAQQPEPAPPPASPRARPFGWPHSVGSNLKSAFSFLINPPSPFIHLRPRLNHSHLPPSALVNFSFHFLFNIVAIFML